MRWSLDRQDRLLFPTSGGQLSVRTDLTFAGDELWRFEARGGWAIALARSGRTVLSPRAGFGVSDDADHRSFWFDPGGHRGHYGYWPNGDAPPDSKSWDKSVQAFRDDLQAMIDLVANPEINLYAKIPHGDGQTILREALLVADHNAYHLGQLVFLRRCLGSWED